MAVKTCRKYCIKSVYAFFAGLRYHKIFGIEWQQQRKKGIGVNWCPVVLSFPIITSPFHSQNILCGKYLVIGFQSNISCFRVPLETSRSMTALQHRHIPVLGVGQARSSMHSGQNRAHQELQNISKMINRTEICYCKSTATVS